MKNLFSEYRQILITFFSLFFLLVFLQAPLFAILEKEEAEFFQCLTRSNNPWAQRRLETLYKTLKSHYQPIAAKDPEAALKLGHYMALAGNREEGLSYILPLADQGHKHARYLAGLFLSETERVHDAMRYFSGASIQGHEEALSLLTIDANQGENPFAMFELARFFSFKGDKSAEAQCLGKIVDKIALSGQKLLIQGHILMLGDDFKGALQLYRQAAATDPEEAQANINLLFEDPNALLQLLKADAFINGEFETAEQRLLAAVKNNAKAQEELKKLALKSPSVAYVLGCALLGTEARSKKPKGKKKQPNGKKPTSPPASSLDYLFFAAGEKHSLAQQKLKQIVDERKQSPLWERYGTFLVGQGDKEGGEAYFKKVASQKKTGKKPISPMELPELPAPPAPKKTPDWYQAGLSLEKSGKTDQAIEAFEKVLGVKKTEASMALGRIHYKRYRKAKKETPDQANVESVLKYLLPLTEKNHPESLYLLGKFFYEQKQYEQAKLHWEKALAGGFGRAACRLGIYYGWIEGNKEKAEEYFVQAIKSEVIKAHHHAALLRAKLGDVDTEVSNLCYGALAGHVPSLQLLITRAEEKVPTALFNLGTYYFKKDKFDEAKKCWDQLPKSEDFKYAKELANNYAVLERAVEEEKKANAAKEHISLGDRCKENNQLKEAAEHYWQALCLEPKNGKVLYKLGLLDYGFGYVDAAVGRFTQAAHLGEEGAFLKLYEIYKVTKNPLAALNVGTVFCAAGDLNKAIKHWNFILNSKLKLEAHFNICINTFLDGNVKKSIEFGERAIEAGEQDFVKHLQTYAHQEEDSREKRDEKNRAKKVLEGLNISLKAPEPAQKEGDATLSPAPL
jgi:tetratricopeptide (TPR) repeat protein